MFTYRLLILAAIILSAKIIFADILVPNYKLQYRDNPSYQQPQSVIEIPHYKVPSAVVQYAKQITVQPPKQPLEVQTAPQVRSNLVGYPYHSRYYHHPYHHHLFTRPNKYHYVKLGSRDHVRPSIFVGYANPLAVHYRRKRSTDLTSTSDKPAVPNVATKSALIDTKHPTAIDSLLPENESTDTNDKHVKNRRRDADFATKSFLFGLDPNKMHSEIKGKTEDETQHSLSKRHPATLITPVFLSHQLTPESTKTTTVTEPAHEMLTTYSDKGQSQEASSTNYENPQPTPSVPSTTNLEQPSNPITISQTQPLEKESHENSKYYNYGTTYPYASPMSIKYPYTYWVWPNFISNAEMRPSNGEQYPLMQQIDQATLQKTIYIDTINTQLKEDTTSPTSNPKSSKNEIISAPNPHIQPFYTYPYTLANNYFGEYVKNYQNNRIDTDDDYDDYNDDYNDDSDEDDYDDDLTSYVTNNFNIYRNKNFAYSRNVPSNKVSDNYANAQSNAPVTYVVSTSPDVQPRLDTYAYPYYYPTMKTYATYRPYYYNYKYYYNTIYPNYQNVPNVYYRALSSPISSYYY